MTLKGSFVQRLIQFFETVPMCDCKYTNNEFFGNNDNQNTASKQEPATPTEEAVPESNQTEANLTGAGETQNLKSLPIIHSSAFSAPSLQMLFEMVGFRPWQRSVLNLALAQFCHHFFKFSDVLHRPLLLHPTTRRFGYSLDDLIHLNHQCDVLDNVDSMRPPCNCLLLSKTKPSEDKEKKECPRHRPTWPAPRSRVHVRRRSADEPTVRSTSPKVYNLPTLTEILKEKLSIEEAPMISEPRLISEVVADTPMISEPRLISEEVVADTCEALLMEGSITTTAAELEDFNANVEKTIEEVQRSFSLPPSETPKNEEEEEKKPLPKSRSNRLKRKLLAKLPSTGKENSEMKAAAVLARRRLHQQRLNKKEMRRVRHLFRNTINPSIFSQFCATKGDARCSERIEWKSDHRSHNRPLSPNIDVWSALAERDSILEKNLYKPVKTMTRLPSKATKDETDSFFMKSLANIEPITPCCHCSCHYGFNKADMATEMETISMDAYTQTTSFVSYDQPGIWARRKESRTKSEGGIEKQPTWHNVTKRFLDFINEQTACVMGNKHQRVNDKQETTEFRQFLLSRFLEHSANQKVDPEQDIEEIVEPKIPEKQSELKTHDIMYS